MSKREERAQHKGTDNKAGVSVLCGQGFHVFACLYSQPKENMSKVKSVSRDLHIAKENTTLA